MLFPSIELEAFAYCKSSDLSKKRGELVAVTRLKSCEIHPFSVFNQIIGEEGIEDEAVAYSDCFFIRRQYTLYGIAHASSFLIA